MITSSRQPTLGTKRPSIDDFKVIRGIGSSVEDRLHTAGILTYNQLADMTPREIAKILKELVGFTPERIAKQDWTGQARKYAADTDIIEADNETPVPQGQQHYAVFTLELLLDEENSVRRTKVMHVQSQKEKTWAGWDGDQLLGFFIEQASLPFPSARIEVVTTFQAGANSESTQASQLVVKPQRQITPSGTTGRIHLLNLELHPIAHEGSKHSIRGDQPFNLRLTLDLTEVKNPANTPVRYSAVIYARGMGSYQRQVVGSSEGLILPANRIDIDVQSAGLACGVYRMDAIVLLSPPDQEPKPGSGPLAMIEGGLFQVY